VLRCPSAFEVTWTSAEMERWRDRISTWGNVSPSTAGVSVAARLSYSVWTPPVATPCVLSIVKQQVYTSWCYGRSREITGMTTSSVAVLDVEDCVIAPSAYFSAPLIQLTLVIAVQPMDLRLWLSADYVRALDPVYY
jgi:hypothetical protein